MDCIGVPQALIQVETSAPTKPPDWVLRRDRLRSAAGRRSRGDVVPSGGGGSVASEPSSAPVTGAGPSPGGGSVEKAVCRADSSPRSSAILVRGG